jgi:hypothetical protein
MPRLNKNYVKILVEKKNWVQIALIIFMLCFEFELSFDKISIPCLISCLKLITLWTKKVIHCHKTQCHLKCFKIKSCPSPLWVRIPTGTLDSLMWWGYLASLRDVGVSTQVPVHAWNNARKGTWGLPPPVKLERRHMAYTVLVWRKTQSNKQRFKWTM